MDTEVRRSASGIRLCGAGSCETPIHLIPPKTRELLESGPFYPWTSRNRALKILATVRWWLNQSRLGRERGQALGQTVQLPVLSESGRLRPTWRLVLQEGR